MHVVQHSTEREREREREGAKFWDTERERMKCGEGYWRVRWDSTIGLVRQERRVYLLRVSLVTTTKIFNFFIILPRLYYIFNIFIILPRFYYMTPVREEIMNSHRPVILFSPVLTCHIAKLDSLRPILFVLYSILRCPKILSCF